MYHHIKKLMYTVRVGTPDPVFGKMLLEQFGGANGELAAAMQYTIQGINCEDAQRKDLFMDIGTEEISHLEVIGTLALAHLKPCRTQRSAAEANPLCALVGLGGVSLHNSVGNPWTADYLKITGLLEVDLRNDIAAEARAKATYEQLLRFAEDAGTIDALKFLMAREIAHMKAFMRALDTLGLDPLQIGEMPVEDEFVRPYFNDSTGDGDAGTDERAPWNQADDVDYVDAPALRGLSGDEAS